MATQLQAHPSILPDELFDSPVGFGDPLDAIDETELPMERRGPAPYPIDDDGPEESYANYSQAILREQRADKEPLFIVWTQNLLMLAGLQWWRYDKYTGAFLPPKGPSWKEFPVRNICMPLFRHIIAKVTKNRPASIAVPASTDPEDIHAGQLADDIARGKWQELRLWKVLRRLVAWVVPTGNAWAMVYWNTDSGILQPLTTVVEAVQFDSATGQPVGVQEIEVPCDENGDPILDENGNYDTEAEPAYIDIGEVGVKVLSPFQVFSDAGAEDEEESTFFLIADPMTLREAHRRWPEAGNLQAVDVSEYDRFDAFITGAASGADTHMAGAHMRRDIEAPRTLTLHYYERPSQDYPFGRHWVSCGNSLLESPGPLPDGVWPPVVAFKDIPVPGQLHAESVLTAAIGLQREYNEVNAQIKEHHNLLLRGKWLVPLGSNIKRGQITTEPGEVIQHTPGLPPVMAQLRPLPQEVYQERARILEDFQLITGMHRISMGSPPPGVTSGRAFLTLQEADDSDIAPLLETVENGVAQMTWLMLQIIRKFYDEERLVRVAGGNHRYRVRAFKGADLRGVVDVVAQSGSSFPWSQVAKQDMMIQLAQNIPQLFEDPETGMFDTERFRRLLPIGGEEAVGLGYDLDIAEAQREEEAFETWDGSMTPEGIPMLPMPQPWQNAQIHVRQHSRVLKSESFLRWPPENQQAFVMHFMETQQVIIDAQMAQMQREMEMAESQGRRTAGGGKSGAVPPSGGAPKSGYPHDLSDAESDPVSG